ncbi:MAG: hypothetical protein JNM70_04715 [Anaerolineae bacterium]|nr:hypothetical protein [Anaerolineae bacterium]
MKSLPSRHDVMFRQAVTNRACVVIPMHILRAERKSLLVRFRRLLLSFGLLVLALPVFAQDDSLGRTWSIPMFLGDGWWQSMALDIEGNLHVSWYDAIDDNNVFYDVLAYRKRDIFGNWTDTNNVIVTGTGGVTVRNALATTSNGMLHAALRFQFQHVYANAPVVGADNAANWSKDLVELDDVGYYLDMIADRQDTLHVVVSARYEGIDRLNPSLMNAELVICPTCSDLYYLRSANYGKTWEGPFPISVLQSSGSDRPHVFEGQSGRLYITWEEGLDWNRGTQGVQPKDVRFVYSDDGGITWSDPIILSGDRADAVPLQMSLAEIDPKRLITIWHYSSDEDRGIYYQVSDDEGVTWTDPTPIPSIYRRGGLFSSQLDRYALVTDRLGLVHLFAVGQPSLTTTANPTLYHMIYQPLTDSWSQPQRILYSPEQQPEWPEAIVGPSNDIHLIWFIRGLIEGFAGMQSNTAILKVYYSYLPGNMAAQPTVAFSPTETPLPSPTPFRLVDSTATPVSTVRPLETSLALTTRDNYAAQTLLGAIGVVAFLCAGIVAYVRLRGR